MPIESLADPSFAYYLIGFAGNGQERRDDPDGVMSERAVAAVREQSVSDVFIASHGWQGDVPSARDQYTRWITTMLACEDDRRRMRQVRPAFTPLVIGFHWPSRPFGEEELAPRRTFGEPAAGPSVDALVDAYAERLVDTPAARDALRTIITAAQTAGAPPELPPAVRDAYVALDRELALGADGPAAAPGADREAFDPDRAYAKRGAMAAGSTFADERRPDALLAPLRQLSFWRMKDRARRIGETAGARLLASLQAAAGSDVRFHLMGHSFGCIVVSAIAKGVEGDTSSPRPIHSMALVQGALSLWSYGAEVPDSGNAPGYFRSLITGKKVRGALITTQSRHDTAVGRFYPVAAGSEAVVRQTTFARSLPRYGALGSFGAQGTELVVNDWPMRPSDQSYDFSAGGIYNLESSAYICEGGGLSGAHSDITRPEVAHAVWTAAMTPP